MVMSAPDDDRSTAIQGKYRLRANGGLNNIQESGSVEDKERKLNADQCPCFNTEDLKEAPINFCDLHNDMLSVVLEDDQFFLA